MTRGFLSRFVFIHFDVSQRNWMGTIASVGFVDLIARLSNCLRQAPPPCPFDYRRPSIHPPSHPPTHPPTHSPTHPPTHPPTYPRDSSRIALCFIFIIFLNSQPHHVTQRGTSWSPGCRGRTTFRQPIHGGQFCEVLSSGITLGTHFGNVGSFLIGLWHLFLSILRAPFWAP